MIKKKTRYEDKQIQNDEKENRHVDKKETETRRRILTKRGTKD